MAGEMRTYGGGYRRREITAICRLAYGGGNKGACAWRRHRQSRWYGRAAACGITARRAVAKAKMARQSMKAKLKMEPAKKMKMASWYRKYEEAWRAMR